MRRSHVAILSALGAIVGVALLAAVWVRFARPDAVPPPALSGERATRTDRLSDFTGIDAEGQWQVTVTRADAWSVELSFPAELEDYVRVRVVGRTLTLDHDLQRIGWSDFGNREDLAMSARITMPALEEIDVSGALLLTFSGFTGAQLDIDASGATNIEGTDSRYDEIVLDASGAGVTNLAGVVTMNANVDLSGAETATLRMAGGRLVADVSGVSVLEYSGAVSSQELDTSGASSVRKTD